MAYSLLFLNTTDRCLKKERIADQVKVTAMKRCPHCKKILFRKKNGSLTCPNECDSSTQRIAFNTVIDPLKDRRDKTEFDPWVNVKY